jgi:hypothetical protein
VSPENANMDQGRLAISTELSAANTHSIASLRACGSAGRHYARLDEAGSRRSRISRCLHRSTTALGRRAGARNARHFEFQMPRS